MHRLLAGRGGLARAEVEDSYWPVWRKAAAGAGRASTDGPRAVFSVP